MKSFDEFKMGDALWEYLKSKRTRSWYDDAGKRADIEAEAREQGCYPDFPDCERDDHYL